MWHNIKQSNHAFHDENIFFKENSFIKMLMIIIVGAFTKVTKGKAIMHVLTSVFQFIKYRSHIFVIGKNIRRKYIVKIILCACNLCYKKLCVVIYT